MRRAEHAIVYREQEHGYITGARRDPGGRNVDEVRFFGRFEVGKSGDDVLRGVGTDFGVFDFSYNHS